MGIIKPIIFLDDDQNASNNNLNSEIKESRNTQISLNSTDNNLGCFVESFQGLHNSNVPLSMAICTNTDSLRINTPAMVSINEPTMTKIVIDNICKSNESAIRISETVAKNNDKLRFKRESKEIDEEAEIRKDVKHPIIFKNPKGELYYYFDNGKKRSSPTLLLDIYAYNSILYSATDINGLTTQILTINWKPSNNPEVSKSIYLLIPPEGISATKINKILISKGLKLLTSSRKQKDLAEALLYFSTNNSREEELPYSYGWNLLSDGIWKFAHENELTMSLIIKNHFMNIGGTKNVKLY